MKRKSKPYWKTDYKPIMMIGNRALMYRYSRGWAQNLPLVLCRLCVVNRWFESYSSNISQYVEYNNSKSDTKLITHGDMLDVLGWTPLSQGRQEARLILFYKIISGLAQVTFEGVLVEAYKGTRRKHNMKFRQIGHTTSQYGQSFFF